MTPRATGAMPHRAPTSQKILRTIVRINWHAPLLLGLVKDIVFAMATQAAFDDGFG
jgi:hypothetical protein